MRKIRFPVVDIRPLMFPEKASTSEIGSVVDKIREASRSHGFFHVVGKFRTKNDETRRERIFIRSHNKFRDHQHRTRIRRSAEKESVRCNQRFI